MKEKKWIMCTDPDVMLNYIGTMPKRKLRLFACACCRRHWHLRPDERSREAVAVSEMYADGLVCEEELKSANKAAWEAAHDRNESGLTLRDFIEHCLGRMNGQVSIPACNTAIVSHHENEWCSAKLASSGSIADVAGFGWFSRKSREKVEKSAQCQLLRCIFGNPFKPSVLKSSRFTPAVRQLAATIYEDRGFDRMPVLADALEESGCDDQEVLKHCRSGGKHVRGCYVVDLVLGKQ